MKLLFLLAALPFLAGATPLSSKNFEADSMLAVGEKDASSYATKRAEFEADAMLSVGEESASSYAIKRGKFESDAMLAVGNEFSSYAQK